MSWDGDKNERLNREYGWSAPAVSIQMRPNPEMCCEACVFGRGEHSKWCKNKTAAACSSELLGPHLAEGQSLEEFCQAYQRCNT